jgi:nucleotide-binding universal stress UspA family protein
MKSYRNILVPVDGSAPSWRATREAIALARRLKARITGLHVVALYAVKRRQGRRSPDFLANFEVRAKKKAGKIFSRLEAACRAARVRCDCRTVWDPLAADAIARFATERRCELIVMGSHGENGMRRVLMGSIARAVIARSRVPVLVCR